MAAKSESENIIPDKPLLLVNEHSGMVKQAGPAMIEEDIAGPFRNAGYDLVTHVGDVPYLLSCLEDAVSSGEADLIISAGGDGTILAIAEKLCGTDVPLFPAPAGTMNMLATDLGYNQKIDIAAKQAVTGKPKPADVARLNDKIFMNSVIIGTFAEIADIREDLRGTDGILEDLTAAADLTQALLDAGPERFSIKADGDDVRILTNTLMVSNNIFSGVSGLAPTRDYIDEGILGLYQFESTSGRDFLSIIAQTVMGNLENMDQVTVQRCKTCVIDFRGQSVSYAIDGEPQETTEPLHFSIAPKALNLWAPEKSI